MSRKRVLIVDDEAELLDMLRIAFEQNDFAVATAGDGKEGLKAVAAKKPDAIVLDIKMPRLNGYEFLTCLRKDPRHTQIPVLILTSLTEASETPDEQWAQRLEVKDFVSKPIEPFTLVKRVQQMLGIPASGS